MPLTPGTKLGLFEITGHLGAGGMGDVFRARDTKLGRDVAIKVLPEAFAFDPDRVARFQREAKVLASLNHPHIAALYGMEESGGRHFLIMEFVDGETLAERCGSSRDEPRAGRLRFLPRPPHAYNSRTDQRTYVPPSRYSARTV